MKLAVRGVIPLLFARRRPRGCPPEPSGGGEFRLFPAGNRGKTLHTPFTSVPIMRLLPWLPPCRPPHALAALGFLLLFPAGVSTTRADDTVRRAQEELRKRNLYFGDIDGVANRGTVGALKRYQDRKRLAITGEVDGETLSSLGIPSAHGNLASAPIEPDPWPDVPVLRSDLGRRPPPLAGGAVLAGETPTPVTEVVAAGGNAAVGEPSPAGEAGALTPEAARNFIANYLRDGSSNDLRAEMGYYADVVDYFNKERAPREYIRRDVNSYYKRWPERHYEILGPVTVTPGGRAGETAVRFQVHYRCRSPGHQAEGRTENVFTVQGLPPHDLRIVGMKEQRVR